MWSESAVCAAKKALMRVTASVGLSALYTVVSIIIGMQYDTKFAEYK